MYARPADIARALRNPPQLDDSAAREWQRKGAELSLPPPTLRVEWRDKLP